MDAFSSTALAEPAIAVVDQLARGVIFLGGDARSRYYNHAAERILSRSDGLSLDRSGRCRAVDPSEQATLSRLIDGAIGGHWPPELNGFGPSSGGALAVSRISGRRPYGVVVAPLPSAQFGLATDRISAIVFISDPEAKPVAQRDLLRSLYCLSEKEAELAIRLSAGDDLGAVAESMGITYQTSRTYLKSVFAKLGINRQTKLVSFVQWLAG
jgi:DNA-binding CsgD family transcriptional regulator